MALHQTINPQRATAVNPMQTRIELRDKSEVPRGEVAGSGLNITTPRLAGEGLGRQWPTVEVVTTES